ncbi:TorD/DmsD family molecular chaperone [Rhodoplanes roseus]|uniref:Molecular chaperone TorD n=1 Tax=Rhodoplanes roseus TaxID=29409 RepID=A0A327KYZ4_9BRAD|nr:molecular chaperone TorD family protein [Rhodoplanes roseus]RAI42835.1 hypothetical protein CH341_17445 [Rhodoplanes roseus]
MDAVTSRARGPLGPSADPAGAADAALDRARLCHFLELALAHPAEAGVTHLCADDTAAALLDALDRLPGPDEARGAAGDAALRFVAALRGRDYAGVEADYIAMFAANYPLVPCPPYGSLFVVDEAKRLDEMLAVKAFFHDSGVDLSEGYDDLPDHVCVELELMQILAFREHAAAEAGDAVAVADARRLQGAFLDRFLQPFADKMASVALRMLPDNPYVHLLDVLRRVLVCHRADLAAPALSSRSLENQP